MPRVDIWIRKSDWNTWESIQDKPGWIHSALLMAPQNRMPESVEVEDLPEPLPQDIQKLSMNERPSKQTSKRIKDSDLPRCPHGFVLGFCTEPECQ